jgi:hypothetical protein
MNQRTLELALQAGLKKEHGSDREYMGEFDWREFAELLVQECAEVAKQNDADGSLNYNSGRTWAGIDILKHFGIES